MTSVPVFLEGTVIKMLLDQYNYKINLIAVTDEAMENKDQLECCYLKDEMDCLIICEIFFRFFFHKTYSFPE